MAKRSPSATPLVRKVERALSRGGARISPEQAVEFIRMFKSKYPDTDIELAQPMLMARGYGDWPDNDFVQLTDADVLDEEGEIEFADWWGPYELWQNDRPQSKAAA